jgi:hypothetical protein
MAKEPDWYKFQEKICNHFNSIGAISRTNITLQGVRTEHDIDILVKTKFLGQNITWIVEAKKWSKKVNKLHVLALRTIIDDIGADKGFIISEKGFQSGAIEAAKNSNISLTTFEELLKETSHYVQDEILNSYKKRLQILENRYWSHSKSTRKEYGLRGEIWDYPENFSGNNLLNISTWAIMEAEKNNYPINLDTHMVERKGELVAYNFQELTNWLNLNLNYLDEKILKAEIEMQKHNKFNPILIFREQKDLPSGLLTMKKQK